MTTWNIDPAHSTIGFAVRHLGFAKVRGRFKQYEARIEMPDDDLSKAVATATIEVASVDTDQADRDAHLRNSDFFDVAAHPHIAFRSTGFREDGDTWEVDGDITIRGVTRPITVTVDEIGRAKDPWGNDRVVLTARARIPNRKEFGLQWNVALEAGGFLVGDAVDIVLEVQAVRQAAAA